MSGSHESSIEIHGAARHRARISQQGQGYQVNIDQAFFDTRPPANSPWLHQFDGWPVLSEIDPLEIGVHRAPISQGNAVPPYIGRDVDAEIKDKISRACRRGGLVVIVGDSTAGKTRSAYESLLAIAPARHLFQPYDRGDIRGSLLTLVSHRQECVVWVDDLEQYVGLGGLTSDAVAYLKRAGVAMVATIRGEQYRRLLQEVSTDHIHQDDRTVLDFQRVIDQSQAVFLPRLWSRDEIARAQKSSDGRVLEAVQHSDSFGISEYLAAGPLLLDEWSIAWGAEANPRGASLIAAAVDCARAGIDVPIPRNMLVDVHDIYLENAGGELLRPESLEQAFSWATRRRSGVASPLISRNSGESYRAFDYLVDSLMRKASMQPIPGTVWSRVLEFAKSKEGLLVGVALAARRQEVPGIELESWEALAGAGDSQAAMQLGRIFQRADKLDIALQWYGKAAEMGESEGWTYIGLIHERRKNAPAAEDLFRQAAEAGNSHGMNHLAMILQRNGNVEESEYWYREALAGREKREDLSLNLSFLLAEAGRLDEAEAIYREAIDNGEADALYGLGILLSQSGRRNEARDLWRKAVEKGDANAAAQLALAVESNREFREAEVWWRRAIALGSREAVLGLAIMLDTSKPSRRIETEDLFRQALDLGVDNAVYGYGVFLLNQQRLDEAETWIRKAIEDGDEDDAVPYLLGSILEARGANGEDAAEWWERAAQLGHRTARAKLGAYLSRKGDLDGGKKWLTLASDAGDEQARCELASVHARAGDRAEAERLFLAAFDSGHAHAACSHGNLLVSLNEPEAAIERYKAAYHAGHRHAAEILEKMYRAARRGREAAEWMRRAREGSAGARTKNVKKPKGRKRRKR